MISRVSLNGSVIIVMIPVVIALHGPDRKDLRHNWKTKPHLQDEEYREAESKEQKKYLKVNRKKADV